MKTINYKFKQLKTEYDLSLVAIPEKTVKRIHERQKTGVIDAEQVKMLEQAEKNTVEESEIQRIIDEELKQEK